MTTKLILPVGLLALLSVPLTVSGLPVSAPWPQAAGQAKPATAGQAAAGGYVGSETCATCHDEIYQRFRKSVHYQAETPARAEGRACESCHGPGKQHVDSGGDVQFIFSFTQPHTVRELSDRCLACHGKEPNRFEYRSSNHMSGSIACSSCHQPHAAAGKNDLLLQAGYELCIGCHKEIVADINLNERHRIKEGIVRCVDCHNQHGPNRLSALGPFNVRVCYRCHTDKQGPFVYEHPAVRVEGCTACHRPHGGINRHMLLYQSTAKLCYSCHVEVPSFHSRFNETTNCVNCHSQIHGSNQSPFFLR